MEVVQPRFKKYLLVCENEREAGKCCAPDGARLRESLKEKIKEKGLTASIRVSRTGCLDVCAQGPNILLMPDAKWFKHVQDQDLDAIVEEARQGL
jgi:(2Fe-2S) ferredoxin